MKVKLVAVFVGGVLSVLVVELVLRLVPALYPSRFVWYTPGERVRSSLVAQRQLMSRNSVHQGLTMSRRCFQKYFPNVGIAYSDANTGVTTLVATDEFGYVNPPGVFSRSEWFDAVFLGDSMVEGMHLPLEEKFTFLLHARGYRVYNLGRIASDPDEYLANLAHFLEQGKKTRKAVLVFFEGNDFQVSASFGTGACAARAGAGQIVAPPVTIRNRWVRPVFDHLYTPNWAFAAWSSVSEQRRVTRSSRKDLYCTDDDQCAPPGPLPPEGAEFEATYRKLGDVFRDLKQLTSAGGSEPHVVYLPAKLEFLLGRVKMAESLRQSMGEWFVRERNAVRGLAEGHGIPFFDLTPRMRDAFDKGRDLWVSKTDGHYGAVGHQIIAEAVTSMILQGREAPADTSPPGKDKRARQTRG